MVIRTKTNDAKKFRRELYGLLDDDDDHFGLTSFYDNTYGFRENWKNLNLRT